VQSKEDETHTRKEDDEWEVCKGGERAQRDIEKEVLVKRVGSRTETDARIKEESIKKLENFRSKRSNK
jgi:hypothetical protein